jgi:hypothetical protein
MCYEQATMDIALQRLGISVTPDPQARRGWGWSMHNDKIIRPWAGAYATYADAADAAIDWVLQQTWRGVLAPILQSATSPDERLWATNGDARRLGSSSEDLLAPWVRAFERGVLADAAQPLSNR